MGAGALITRPGEPVVKISGRVYPERPPIRGQSAERARRAALIVSSLRYAASECGETERSLYKSILQALAHAENLRDGMRGNSLQQSSLHESLKDPNEP